MGVTPAVATRRALLRFVSSPHRPRHDRSDTRPAVPQRHGGRPIEEIARRHRGGACAVLFNGGSLAGHDLHAIKVPLIGMNRTYAGRDGYEGPQPDYYCWVDLCWKDTARALDAAGVVTVNGSTDHAAVGYRATRSMRMAPFSFDLARDGYVSPIPCTTGHLALQLAAYLGFTDIYCLGLDMGGPHFDGTESSGSIAWANAYHRRQAGLLAERGIRVWVTGAPKSRCTAFPHAPFSQLLEAA